MKALNRISAYLLVLVMLVSCTPPRGTAHPGVIYPDYTDVTVPCNIAPLNFHYVQDCGRRCVTTFTAGDVVVRKKGRDVVFKDREWRELCNAAAGGSIEVASSFYPAGWKIFVSKDPVDAYLSYRLIEPGYEVWHEVSIEERNVEGFDVTVLSDWKHTNNACMNCHVHSQGRGDLSMMYVRGKNGGAFLNRGGQLRKLNLKADGMYSGTVYGELHPSGRYGVFSTNIIIPGFHSDAMSRLEVYDTQSDLVVADFDGNRLITMPHTARADVFETFPAFSADGKYVYYCAADTVALPSDVHRLRYSLMRVSFDETDGSMGSDISTVWNAERHGASVCHPKCSPDGRYLMFTVADYGTFPIWHRECDLQVMDLETGAMLDMDVVNSDLSDTYHSWSSNSSWFVFASKRGDGQYGKPYYCHVNGDGTFGKPFVLPQQDPYFYEQTTRSFNIPDMSCASVGFDAQTIGSMCADMEAEPFN